MYNISFHFGKEAHVFQCNTIEAYNALNQLITIYKLQKVAESLYCYYSSEPNYNDRPDIICNKFGCVYAVLTGKDKSKEWHLFSKDSRQNTQVKENCEKARQQRKAQQTTFIQPMFGNHVVNTQYGQIMPMGMGMMGQQVIQTVTTQKIIREPKYRRPQSRTIILMDATSSMSRLLQRSKETVQEMFVRANTVLQENNRNDRFFVQIVAYRNYQDGPDKLLQLSKWESDHKKLYEFMGGVLPLGGSSWGEEAIEVALQYVNLNQKQHKNITQAILIGDIGPNSQAQVNIGRTLRDFSNTHFNVPTYWETEVEQLKQQKVPVHAFYVSQRAKPYFDEIAKRTNGKSDFLDVNGAEGAKLLTDVITTQILDNIGGEELVKAYRRKYVTTIVTTTVVGQPPIYSPGQVQPFYNPAQMYQRK